MENNFTIENGSIKKMLLLVIASITLLLASVFSPFGVNSASAATTASKKYEYTTSYGNITFLHDEYYVGVSGNYTGKIEMLTYITVNEKGVTINKVTQSAKALYPLVISGEGTKIIYKNSNTYNQKAQSYAKFRASLFIKGLPVGHQDYELNTVFRVKKIDKVKKKVTFEVQNLTAN
ncbi:hypothetical protein ABC255_16435 [Neobacillus sp. 3P2-tot-E-2]|uniref:hypothetical protein n=1 Tax=Neobacillus sp. 3P2-tot-E-2 TaxID=3132212 RepID=UPI0039A058D8